MPRFVLKTLPQSFVDHAFSDELRTYLGRSGAIAQRVPVVVNKDTTVSLLVMTRVDNDGIAHPHWARTVLTPHAIRRLQIKALDYVCIYNPADDQFHRLEVSCTKTDQIESPFWGILGWNDISREFDIVGSATPKFRHVTIAAKRKFAFKCLPRTTANTTVFPEPDPEEDT